MGDSEPNGVHILSTKDWKVLSMRVSQTYDIARRAEDEVGQIAREAKSVAEDITLLRKAVETLSGSLLQAALAQKPTGFWDPDAIKSLNRTHWAFHYVLLGVVALLLVGEKANFIRQLLP